MRHIALKIPLSLHRAVVLAYSVFKFDTDPLSGREGGLASKPDSSEAAIVELDHLAGFVYVPHPDSAGRGFEYLRLRDPQVRCCCGAFGATAAHGVELRTCG